MNETLDKYIGSGRKGVKTLIKDIRSCKTIAEEKGLIQKCSA